MSERDVFIFLAGANVGAFLAIVVLVAVLGYALRKTL